MDGIANMNLGNYKYHSIDGFGDDYECLMSMYESNVDKRGWIIILYKKYLGY